LGNFKPDEDGSYFIDRNPKYFDYVFDYLRSGKLPPTYHALPTGAQRIIRDHFDYCLVDFPTPYWDMKRCGPSITVSEATVSYHGVNNGWMSALGARPVATRLKYRITEYNGTDLMIGLSPTSNSVTNNHSYCGWYMNASNFSGQLASGGSGSLTSGSNRCLRTGDEIEFKIGSDSAMNIIVTLNNTEATFLIQQPFQRRGDMFGTVPQAQAQVFPALSFSAPGASIKIIEIE